MLSSVSWVIEEIGSAHLGDKRLNKRLGTILSRLRDAQRAQQVVQWYLARWQIETFFKILKSGCKIEALQFESLKATSNCIAVYFIVGWRILYLTRLGRGHPELDCDVVFEESEWKSVFTIVTKRKAPEEVPKLRELLGMIAHLGGFLGRKSDGLPGPQVMWIGLQRMRDFALAWETFHATNIKTYV